MSIRIQLIKKGLQMSDENRLKNMPFSYPDIEVIRNLEFSNTVCVQGEEICHLDLYHPKYMKGPLPVILDIHGGGLVYGDKILNQWSAAEMATRGYLVLVPNYPLLPDTTINEQVNTLLQAFQFLSIFSERYHADMSRIYLKGDSAGGLLSILLWKQLQNSGIIGDNIPSIQIRGIGLIHPLTRLWRRDILSFLSDYLETPLQSIDVSDPNLYFEEILEQFPPAWLVSSRNDLIFFPESRKFVSNLEEKGRVVEFHDYKISLLHPLGHIFMITHPKIKESQDLYKSLDYFFRRDHSSTL